MDNTIPMEISCSVISHKKASIKDIESAWHGNCCDIISRVLSNPLIKECALIFTCNRVEVYVVGKDTVNFLHEFAREMGVPKRILSIYTGKDCLNHILRVASGLESMIVGEDQVLGQVKYFYNVCKRCGGIGEILDLVFRKAIHVGTKVRKLTRINKGSVSIASAGIELLQREVGLNGKNVLIVGAGEMGSTIAKNLRNKANIYIANRTFEKGLKLAKEVGGKAVKFDEIEKYIDICDIIITATSSTKPIITKEMARPNKVFLDIALPRNIEDDVREMAILYTIDDLRKISEENLRRRLREVRSAEKIIEEELNQLEENLKALRAKRAISAMYKRANDIKREEVIEAYNKLKARYNVDEGAIEILDSFANSLVKKFLSLPTLKLKEFAKEGRMDALKLFECAFGGDGFVSSSKNEEIETREIEKTCKRSRG